MASDRRGWLLSSRACLVRTLGPSPAPSEQPRTPNLAICRFHLPMRESLLRHTDHSSRATAESPRGVDQAVLGACRGSPNQVASKIGAQGLQLGWTHHAIRTSGPGGRVGIAMPVSLLFLLFVWTPGARLTLTISSDSPFIKSYDLRRRWVRKNRRVLPN